jgi:Ca-activated chloride channel family protein
LIVVLVTALQAQSAQEPIEDRLVVTSNLVTVNVIVTDGQGKYVEGLSANQFLIYDEGAKQKIAHFSFGASPVSIGIVCEHHSDSEQVSSIIASLKQFVSTLTEHDTFFFTAYSHDGSVTTDFIPSAKQLREHLSVVKPGGPSAFYDVLHAAAARLRQAPHLKKALLVVSDGQDENSKHTYNELRNRLREFDAQVYTIGIVDPAIDQVNAGPRWVYEDVTRRIGPRSLLTAGMGRGVLAEMSRVSGGVMYSAESGSESELTWICDQIAGELRKQYTLGFYPSQLTPQRWHRIKVTIDSPQSSRFSLSYRAGYQFANKKSASIEHINIWAAPF